MDDSALPSDTSERQNIENNEENLPETDEFCEITPSQQQFLDAITDYFKNGNHKKPLFLGGYAGTGKTWLIARLQKKYPKIHVAAYTNKAVSVLKEKHVKNCETIDKTLFKTTLYYKCSEKIEAPKKQDVQTKSQEYSTGGIFYNETLCPGKTRFFGIGTGGERSLMIQYTENKPDAKPQYFLPQMRNNEIEVVSQRTRLYYDDPLVIDESSMLSDQMLEKCLESANGGCVVIGDYAQLPPILDERETFTPYRRKPVVELTEVMRTKDSEILQYATAVRQGQPIQATAAEADRRYQFLCYTNKTANRINEEIMPGSIFQTGCKVYVSSALTRKERNDFANLPKHFTENNYKYAPIIGKGEIGTICEVMEHQIQDCVAWCILDFDGKKVECPVAIDRSCNFLMKYDPTKNRRIYVDNVEQPYDIFPMVCIKAFALTIHKSQGSTFDDVCLVYDYSYLRYNDFDLYKRLSYTALTRAKHSLLIVTHDFKLI